MVTVTVAQSAPLPHREAWPAVARCLATSSGMLLTGRVHQPRNQLGRMIRFADGSRSRVYRETTVAEPVLEPSVLLVSFRLRWRLGRAHRVFEVESGLHTPLFVGFAGFRSKLWLAHDENDLYRGLYEWDGPAAAHHYARSLWRVLALISEQGSIDYRVLPGVARDELLTRPETIVSGDGGQWWEIVAA